MPRRKLASVPFRERLKCTVREAVEYGGVSKNRIHDWIKSGRIKSSKIDDTRRLIDVASLLNVLDGNEGAAAS